MNLSKLFAIACSLLALAPLSLEAAEQQRKVADGGVMTASGHPDLSPVTLVRTLDALRYNRRRANHHQKKKSEPNVDDPLGHLRRIQEEEDGGVGTCEAALAESEENLAACEAQEEAPSALLVQMADQCIFHLGGYETDTCFPACPGGCWLENEMGNKATIFDKYWDYGITPGVTNGSGEPNNLGYNNLQTKGLMKVSSLRLFDAHGSQINQAKGAIYLCKLK